MKRYNQLSDGELTVLLKEGNHAAFTEIYNRYWAVLFRHAGKMLGDQEEAGDIVQDIFTALWDNASTMIIHNSLSGYLYSSVRHKIFTLLTRSKLKTEHLNSLEDFMSKGTYSTDEWIQEKELAASIEAEVSLLPKKMREIFELSRKENLSYQEIADKLDVTSHTVRKQVSNALKVLRTKLSIFFSLLLILLLG